MKDRHEFRFVVEGVALDPEQVAMIGSAIREAGLTAMGRTAMDEGGFAVVAPAAMFDRPRWEGGFVVGRRSAEAQFEELVAPHRKTLQR